MFEVHCSHEVDSSFERQGRLFTQAQRPSDSGYLNLKDGRWYHMFQVNSFKQAIALRKLIEGSGEFKATIREM